MSLYNSLLTSRLSTTVQWMNTPEIKTLRSEFQGYAVPRDALAFVIASLRWPEVDHILFTHFQDVGNLNMVDWADAEKVSNLIRPEIKARIFGEAYVLLLLNPPTWVDCDNHYDLVHSGKGKDKGWALRFLYAFKHPEMFTLLKEGADFDAAKAMLEEGGDLELIRSILT